MNMHDSACIDYQGWPTQLPIPPTSVDIASPDVDPEIFWVEYISKRKPVVLQGIPDELRNNVQDWSPENLVQSIGTLPVTVEVGQKSRGRAFGYGNTEIRPLKDVFDRKKKLYISAQNAPIGPDGHPEVIFPPLSALPPGMIPLRLGIMGNLVPQSINLWAGSSSGTSSGLHHDFHDNLYIVFSGEKRFLLWPPSVVKSMYTKGKLHRVYPNGRIVYKDQGNVLADGSDAADTAAWKAKRKAQMAEKDEEALDAALDAALCDVAAGKDFYDDYEVPPPLPSKGPPPSFSAIDDLTLPPSVLAKRFPKFPGVENALECTVSSGQCLYLPAGWFHEVISLGKPHHCALNYWMHPPDNLNPDAFEQPYVNEYWPDLWSQRERRYCAPGHCDCCHEEIDPASKAEFYKTIRGLFGYGRRHHLHRFVGIRKRQKH